MSNISEIINSCLTGNEYSYKDLYDQTNKLAFYHAQIFLKDRDDIMNAVQTSYVKIFKNLNTLEKPESFNSWLKTIVRNTCVDIIRKNKDLSFSDITYDDAIDFEVEDQSPDSRPDVVAVEQDIKDLLYKILYKLPEDQRICVSMFYFDQMTTKEIAEELNINENSVKSRLKYAREKIKVEVLELEKKGTKIYGLAPIPFLYFLYKESIKSYKVSPKVANTLFDSIKLSTSTPTPLANVPETTPSSGASSPTANTAASTATATSTATTATAVKAGLAKTVIATLTATAVVGSSGYYVYDSYIAKDNAFSNQIIQRSNNPVEIIQQAINLTTKADALDFEVQTAMDSTVHFFVPINLNFTSKEHIQYNNLNQLDQFEFSIVPSYTSKVADFDLSSLNFLFGGYLEHYKDFTHTLQKLPTPYFDENPEIGYTTSNPEVMSRNFSEGYYMQFLQPITTDSMSNIKIKESKKSIEISYRQSIDDTAVFMDQLGDDSFNHSDFVSVRYIIDEDGHIQSYSLNFSSKNTADSFLKFKTDLSLTFDLNKKGNDVIVKYPFN